MNKVLFVSGTSGNGGTQTWTRQYLNNYKSEDFELVHVNLSARRGLLAEASFVKRVIDGLLDLREVYFDVKRALKSDHYPIMHTATSGSLGTLRDYFLVKLAKKYKTKSILHCHYGCIKDDYQRGGLLSLLLKKTLPLYDIILVLDSISSDFLNSIPKLKGKVHIAPNFINVITVVYLSPRTYKTIAFIGTLVPTKGIYELVDAVKSLNNGTTLNLIGPATNDIAVELKSRIGSDEGKSIHTLGRRPNNEAIAYMEKMDIIALPTYYSSEAFPISILEAMSKGSLVLSCPRAAIPDMLTAVDGGLCGLLVEAKSAKSIADAILWAQKNTTEADELRRKAFEKVSTCYSMPVVFDLYSDYYKKMLG